eukprot:gene16773-19946_t
MLPQQPVQPPLSSNSTTAQLVSHEKSSPSPSTFSLNVLMGIMGGVGKRFLPDPISISSDGASEAAVSPPPAPMPVVSLSSSQDGNGALNTNISIISPLTKISTEIIQGNFQYIIILSSCGDESVVNFLSSILVELRDSLKDKPDETICNVIHTLIQSLIYSPFKPYRVEVFKTIGPLSKNLSSKNKEDIYLRYKETLKSLLDASLRDEQMILSPYFCMFLSKLVDGLSNKSKRDFMEAMPIPIFIELMEKAHSKINTIKEADILRAQAAQILVHVAKHSFEALCEIKAKGGLAIMLEVCKLGQVFSHINVDQKDLIIGEFLGAGALARVNQATWQGKQVAVKIFNEGSFSFRLEDFLKEVAIMGLFSHPNLLRLEGACIIPRQREMSTFMIVTELMHKGTLWDNIKKHHPLSFNTIIRHSLSIARGLAYLHSLDLIHRDIKATNILIDENDVAKVGDFGLSRIVDTMNMTSFAGTPKWEAPECLAGEGYTSAADVYSFGITLYEMVTGEEPYPEIQTIVDLVRNVYEKVLRQTQPLKNRELQRLIK